VLAAPKKGQQIYEESLKEQKIFQVLSDLHFTDFIKSNKYNYKSFNAYLQRIKVNSFSSE
jgi:hypothetical protein